jgi:SPP1 family predicted phage head-tail adaptor
MSIEAGRLRHRVRLERYDYLLDSNGNVVQDPTTGETPREWQEVATVWAAVEPVSGREFIMSQAIQSQVTARLTIRHRDDVDASMRAVHARSGRPDVVYNIKAVLADLESGLSYLTLPCSQGTGNGQ